MGEDSLKRIMSLLFSLSLLHMFVIVILPIYLSSLGLTGYEIGILSAIYAITTIFVSFPTGFVNDRWTVRLTMIGGVIFISTFILGLSFFDSFFLFIPLYFLGGLGRNLADVSIRTVYYKMKTTSEEGTRFGKYLLVKNIAASSGALIGSIIIYFLDFSLSLKLIGVFYLFLIPFITVHSETTKRISLGQYRKDIINAKVIMLGIIMLLFSTHWGAETTSYGLFLKNNLNLNMFMVGVYNAGALLFLGISAFVFGRRMDSERINLKNLMILGMAISGIFHVLHTIPVLPLSFVFRVIHEIGDGMAGLAMFFWVSKLFRKERIGGNSSFMFALTLVGQVVGALIYGPLGYHMGYHVPLIISGIMNIICAFLLVALIRMFNIRRYY